MVHKALDQLQDGELCRIFTETSEREVGWHLAAQERELLEYFHALSPKDQGAAVRMAQDLAARPKGEPFNKEELDQLWEQFKRPN